MADRVVVLVGGVIQQVGTPMAVYRTPRNVQVARLIGDPAMNLLSGRLEESEGRLVFRSPVLAVPLPPAVAGAHDLNGARAITLGIRPTEIRLLETGIGNVENGALEVYTFEPFGKYQILTVRAGDEFVKVKTGRTRSYAPGERVFLDLTGADFTLFDAVTGASLKRIGEPPAPSSGE